MRKRSRLDQQKRREEPEKVKEEKRSSYHKTNGLVDDWPVFDAHHLDPSQKKFGIMSTASRPWEVVAEELDKCVLLCSNCHRKLHSGLISLDIPAKYGTIEA